MKLKNKLLALSLLTLLLPWSGWKLLQELERYLRDAQESALLASARMSAATLPLGFQTRLLYAPDKRLRMREFLTPPQLDGAGNEWPAAGEGLQFQSLDERLQVSLQAGRDSSAVYLLFNVGDATTDHEWPGPADSIELLVRNPRGLSRFMIKPGAPGPFSLNGEGETASTLIGYWHDSAGGYRVEAVLPGEHEHSAISFLVRDAGNLGGAVAERFTGTLANPNEVSWIELTAEWVELSQSLAETLPSGQRGWLLDRQAWVLADSQLGVVNAGPSQTTWLQRFLFRLISGAPPEIDAPWPESPIRLNDEGSRLALSGEEHVAWSQTLDTAEVRNTVAVPLRLENREDGEIIGAMVVQSTAEGLLLMTNQALGRLLLTTLGLAIGLALGMWWFAIRLSRRVQRLSEAVSRAMDDSAEPGNVPLTSDRDELGELARNNDRLLRAVADYSHYLQTLAGKLSHELKTPLAITRSSLENLASQQELLESPEGRRYLERAREGVERQTAIVRAMSEASRLESAIESADWETVDIVELLQRSCEAYRAIHPERQIDQRILAGPVMMDCAPDLLTQALDKLVDNAISLSGEEDRVRVILVKDGAQLVLSVENTGTLLPDEFQDRLFDSLVSLRPGRSGSTHLGLGLHIVKLVVLAHGGEVSARNLDNGEGVQFRLILPLKQTGR